MLTIPKGIAMEMATLNLRLGELVEVRSLSEILATLDAQGTYESLPFMPEMVEHCGKRFKVSKRTDRTCVEGFRARGMKQTVLLENLRCDGGAHDGCKRRCMFFWKEAWLKRVDGGADLKPSSPAVLDSASLKTYIPEEERYFCQSTELHKATFGLSVWRNIKTYLKDLRFGNFTILQLLKALFVSLDRHLRPQAKGTAYSNLYGTLTKTPTESLNLQPGDLVEVKSKEEIAATLDPHGRNRGLVFAPELQPYCGSRYRVFERADRIILEMTGKMVELKNTVTLENGICDGMCRRACPRGSYMLWREIWLKKAT
jgi:hypothetical protein